MDGVGNPDCPRCHGLGYLREEVPVGHSNFGKLVPCTCQMEYMQLRQAQQLRSDSNTEMLAGKTFENFLPEGHSVDPLTRNTMRNAYQKCRDFAENIQHLEKHWILLIGTYGCGKTHLAAAIANYCLQHNQPVLFLNTPDLLDYLRATFAPGSDMSYTERFDEIRTAPVLILDDLGTESPTAWAIEKLYQLINYRYNARLPTVITTNKDLKNVDARIASRLSDAEMVTTLTLSAPDFRVGVPDVAPDISTLTIHANQRFNNFDTRSDLTGEARQRFLEAIRAAQEYADQPVGWLVFTGPYGAGKTHLAAAIANARTQAGKPVIFVTYHDLNELFRAAPSREAEERNTRLLLQIKTIELLVLDDVGGVGGAPAYYRDRFFQIFNHRFDAHLSTVLTTSAEEKELDPRLKSRIYHSDMCQVHLLQATAYRGKKAPGGRPGKKRV